jgi:hypothetical protein
MANERARGLGYKFVTDDKYLVDPFSPTDGISYEGDGSPVSYANSGIMTQAPYIYPPINQGGGGGDGPYIIPKDDDDDDETYTGSSMSLKDAAKEAGKMFLMGGPQGYMINKLISKGIGAFKDYRNKNKVEKYTGQEMSSYRDDRPSSEKNYTGGDTNSNPSTPGAQDSFSNKSGMGRTGYFFGGRVNYKAGGRTDAGPNRTTASHSTRGQINESGQQVSGGQTTRDNNDGGGNSPFYGPKPTFFNNPEILNKETILGDIPTGIGFDNSYGRYKATMDLEESLKEKELKGELEYNNNINNFDLAAKYSSQDGPTYGVGYTGNNFDVNVNNQTGANASYSKDIGPGTFTMAGTYNPDGTYNTEARYGISFGQGKKNGGRIGFKNGGLAGLL